MCLSPLSEAHVAHDWRYTYGAGLVREKGIDLVMVATSMGPELLDTMAIHTQPSEENMARAAERLSAR